MNREDLDEAGISADDFPREKVCRHRDGDPDCECHPEEDDEVEIARDAQEPEPVVDEIETLPVQLTSAQITEREIRRLEGYQNVILADVTDAKEAEVIDAKRREVKRARTLTVRICKSEREEAIRTQKSWIAIEKNVNARLEPVEAHLENEAFRHDAWLKAEAAKAEHARLLKVKGRVEQVVKAGSELEMEPVNTLTDEEWETYIANLEAVAARRREATQRAARLTEIGDECSIEEAMEITDDQYAHRLQVAMQAKREREEAERIAKEEQAKRDQEEADRVKAIETKNARLKAEAEENARELKKMREEKAEAERKRVEAEQAAKREAERKELEEREAAAKIERERIEAERVAKEAEEREAAEKIKREKEEALRPERDKIIAWSDSVWKAIPTKPLIEDVNLRNTMNGSEWEIRRILELLCEAMQ